MVYYTSVKRNNYKSLYIFLLIFYELLGEKRILFVVLMTIKRLQRNIILIMIMKGSYNYAEKIEY